MGAVQSCVSRIDKQKEAPKEADKTSKKEGVAGSKVPDAQQRTVLKDKTVPKWKAQWPTLHFSSKGA